MPGTVVTAGWTRAANADAPLDKLAKTTQAAPIEARTDSKVTRASRFWRIGKSVVECRKAKRSQNPKKRIEKPGNQDPSKTRSRQKRKPA
jgi:hypothetical protein